MRNTFIILKHSNKTIVECICTRPKTIFSKSKTIKYGDDRKACAVTLHVAKQGTSIEKNGRIKTKKKRTKIKIKRT